MLPNARPSSAAEDSAFKCHNIESSCINVFGKSIPHNVKYLRGKTPRPYSEK